MVRGVACSISWPMRKSSKKLPAPILDMIALVSGLLGCRFWPQAGQCRQPDHPGSRQTTPDHDGKNASIAWSSRNCVAVIGRRCDHQGTRVCYTIRKIAAQEHLQKQFMSIEATRVMLPAAPAGEIIHPVWVRVTHWINAVAMIVMIGSGWEIYNAS